MTTRPECIPLVRASAARTRARVLCGVAIVVLAAGCAQQPQRGTLEAGVPADRSFVALGR